ncbi:RpiB/LacA/LacB family sugar-phosphate isomerase [Candidatus Kaiserbacteria bacterium]|nr:RpiB/LacA/LacB family sugar-phosphate isomerase [Candidatus Kaiserbacteria bacterium]
MIHLATDHAGLEHKNAVKRWLLAEGYDVLDHGAHTFDATDDFTDFIMRAAVGVARATQTDQAIIFGGSGEGEAMLANRFPGVRATVLYSDNSDIVRLSREHNNANVLSIGARFLTIDDTKKHIWNWLHTTASTDKKYRRRNEKIDALTKNLHS